MRIGIFHKLFFLVFLLLSLALVNLQVIHGRQYLDLSKRNCIRLVPQNGSRGKVTDSSGVVLAGNHASYDVVVLPQETQEVEDTLRGLTGLLGESYEELRNQYRRNYSFPSMPVVVARDVGLKKAAEIEEKRFELDGVIIQTDTSRSYPFGDLASHVLGYISEIDRWRLTSLEDYGYKTRDLVGFGGVEERYDYYLRQEDGGLSVVVDHRGRFVRTVGFKPPESGRDLQLTLDSRLQKIVEEEFGESKGGIIMMDPQTGEVLALASRPDFNPADFGKNPKNTVAQLLNSPAAPLRDRAISSSFPPGSVFKLVVACAGLETGRLSADTTSVCTGSVKVGGRVYKCWGTHGTQDLTQAIAHSCDVFFYRAGLSAGPQAIHDYAVRLGLSKTTGIELPYEASGFVPDPLWKKLVRFQNWYDGDTANFAIGQGELLCTPVQICRMACVFANGGRLVTPYIIKAVDGRDVSAAHRRVVDLRLKKNTVDCIRLGMRQVVADSAGTANIMASLPVAVAGKTGTAQVSGREGDNHAWFAGFFPFDEPRYAICVFLERGGHGFAASTTVKRIIERMKEAGLL